ncbi:ABC transporter substrate-binding protein [Paenibacillus hexagrammi]|uniref:ABC transporter substrate-binding protein n=1 Tax=Paenibacillus hexagrammi TaxID=2908839 RepID=A0ABY3SH48_9BACL|nr:ABC transporter substrate-binding protein [Paenibacillus sp. YPD9-1]UJF32521.1 ABC transporter substrate-binding protein [Paenibacillus sp. YPD9-1]
MTQTKKAIGALSLVLTSSLVLGACAKTDEPSAAAPSSTTAASTDAGAASGSGASSSAAPVKISYWTPFSGGDGEFMTSMVKKFNEEQKEIQVEMLNTKSDDYYTKLQTAIVSDQAPDVAIVHASRMPQFAPSQFIVPLDDIAAKASVNWSDYNANILNSTVFDNKHYSLPLDTHALVMYYNKKFLDQAGVLKDGKPVYDNSPEGFVSFLQKIKDKVPGDIAPLAQPNVRIDSYWMWWGFYNQLKDGGKFYSEDGKKGALNNPAALKSLTYVDDLYKKGLIPPNINDAFKMFQDGKAAVLITGVWGTGAFESTQGLDFGVTTMPQIYDQPATWGDSHTLALPKHSKEDAAKQLAAVKFASWNTSHGDTWAQAGHVPAVVKATQSDMFKGLKYRSDYAKTADFVKYWPRDAKQAPINDEIIKEFEKMMNNKQDPATTLKNSDAIIEKMLSK